MLDELYIAICQLIVVIFIGIVIMWLVAPLMNYWHFLNEKLPESGDILFCIPKRKNAVNLSQIICYLHIYDWNNNGFLRKIVLLLSLLSSDAKSVHHLCHFSSVYCYVIIICTVNNVASLCFCQCFCWLLLNCSLLLYNVLTVCNIVRWHFKFLSKDYCFAFLSKSCLFINHYFFVIAFYND